MRLLIASFLFLSLACGQADLAKSVKAIDGVDGKDAVGCDISKTDGKTFLVCESGTFQLDTNSNDWTIVQNTDGSVTISRPGKPDMTFGAKGPKGDKGDKGDSNLNNPAQSGSNGKDGKDGKNGKDGKDGKDGSSCSLYKDHNGCIWGRCEGKADELLWVPK